MDLYLLSFALGTTGMVAMAVLGVAGGHGGGRAHSSHGARAHGAAPHSGAGHAIASAGRGATGARISGAKVGGARATGARANGARGNRGARTASGGRGGFKDALAAWLSPRVLFTMALGIGATGLLLAPFISSEVLRAPLAFAGGLFLEKALVAPLWAVLMRFGSAPARTLESALLEEAVALTAFDAQGCGMIAITLDGHEMRALARLKPDENNAHAARVRSGDVLLIESVDAARGQCLVSRIQSC